METAHYESGIAVSPGKAGPHETLNLNSLGVALVVAWLAVILWSPIVVPVSFAQGDHDLQMHFMRLSTLVVIALVYLVMSAAAKRLRQRSFMTIAVIVGVLTSPFAVLGNIFPAFGLLCDAFPTFYLVSWALAGVSSALLMLIWAYDGTSKVTYRQGVVNIAMAAIFSGAFFMLCLVMDRFAACVMVALVPFITFALWIADASRHKRANDQDPVESAGEGSAQAAITQVRAVLGGSTFVFVLAYGFITGMAGSTITQVELSHYALYSVGLATFLSGAVTFLVLRNAPIHLGRMAFMVFLPFAVVCLFLLSVLGETGKAVMLFVIFFVSTSYNVENTAYPQNSENTDVPQGGAFDLLRSESRAADMLGAALGWGAATAIRFMAPLDIIPYCYFLIAAILVTLMTLSVLRSSVHDAASAQVEEPVERAVPEPSVSFFQVWEDICAGLADNYGFSTREREIFLLLSHGRDRQYIHNLLSISPSTVRTHTYNIYRKMNVHDQQELIDIVEEALRMYEAE